MIHFYLEKELFDILKEMHSIMKKGGISLQKGRDLYFKAKGSYLISKEEERTKEVDRLMLTILLQVGKISEKFIEEWQSGKFRPHDYELNLLKEGCEEVLMVFDNHFKPIMLLAHQGKPFSAHHAKVKQKVQNFRKLIQEEELSRQQ